MKQKIKITLIVIGVIVVGMAAYYLFGLYKSVGPALLPPVENTTGLNLPAGFKIFIFAKDLVNPRVMIHDPRGNMLVSITSEGKVAALPDKNSDGKADETITVIDGLNNPHGLAMKCPGGKCQLYIAESNQVAVYDYDEINLKATNKKKIVDLPDDGRHFTRTLLFMPAPNDGKLLIAVGSSCDVCDETDWRRAGVLQVNADGSGLKKFSGGLRNSVFMAVHPATGQIWATEMGRDYLGDNLPPDEINILEDGKNYGWPICYGKNIHDTDFDKKTYVRNPCMEPFETPSYIDLPAHNAPLGFAFFPEEGWPQDYWNNILVAYHGSWNSSTPVGYKIVRLRLDSQGNPLGPAEDFITGWLKDNGASGRPVDIIIQPGGIIYVSDDKAGVIYKIVKT